MNTMQWISSKTVARRFGRILGLAALAVVLAPAAFAVQPTDHAKVMGPDECAECHKEEAKIWRNTHHFTTFTEMPRSKKAREIADKLGIHRIKTEPLCTSCHFTTQSTPATPEPQAIAGISCESCHRPAKDWMKRHGGYSGKKKETETPAEAAARWADAEAAGMLRPHMLYDLAKNCYSCHITPNEKLVNTGGHPAGSPFELLSWSQGEVRHTVHHSAGAENRMASPERRRMLYIMGVMVELEESLRAVGKATQKDKYAVTMAKRAQLAAKRMASVAAAVNLPETDAIMAAVKQAKLSLNNEDQLSGIADTIGAQARAVAEKYDGSGMASLDPMIPGEDKYKGKPKS